MTGKELLDKHLTIRKLVEKTVRVAKDKQLSGDQAISLLAREIHKIGLRGKRRVKEIAIELLLV